MTKAKTWSSKHIHDDFVRVDIPLVPNSKWEWWLLLTSDHHLDSPHCDRDLLKKHLQEAKDRNAGIHFNGDTLDLMQGVGDKRASKRELLKAYVQYGDSKNVLDKGKGMLDRIIDDSVDFYKPYADSIISISEGNHEESVNSKVEFNIVQRLVGALNYAARTNIAACPYAGWIKLCFTYGKHKVGTTRNAGSALINYHHGYSGDEAKIPMRAAMFPQADICVSGHTHTCLPGKPWGQDCVTDSGRSYIRQQTHIIIPSYKNEYQDKRSFAVRKFHKVKVLGAVWCRFYFDCKDDKIKWDTFQAQ